MPNVFRSRAPRSREGRALLVRRLAAGGLLVLFAGGAAAKHSGGLPAADPAAAGAGRAGDGAANFREAGPLEVAGDWILRRDEPGGAVRRVFPASPDRFLSKGASRSAAARDILASLPLEAGLGPILDQLEIDFVKRGVASEHVVLRRVVTAIPVEPGRVALHFGRSGALLSIDLSVDAALAPAKSGAAIGPDEALAAAYAGFSAARRPPGRLVYREDEGGLRPVYRFDFHATDPPGVWRVDIDAWTGEEVERVNRSMYVNGSGRIWSPNPVSVLEDTTLRDMNDSDQAALAPAYRIETLRDLDPPVGGIYRLEGPYVRIVERANPSILPPERSHPDSFRTTRSDDAYEAVMAYWHLDRIQRYLRGLGYDGVEADSIVDTPLDVDVHGFNGADNSAYNPPPEHFLEFGDGCVDDAEDADVLIHEYGHVIEYSQVPNWGYPGGYMGAMAEGFSDYWAESHAARSGIAFDLGQVFDWDKNRMESCHWAGRRTDNAAVVPDSLYPQTLSYIYKNSLIWSGALWEIHQAIGGDASDRAILESHFFLNGTSPNATFEDGAWAVLQADEELTGGENALAIFDAFRNRGILTEENTAAPLLTYAAHPETLYTETALPCSLRLVSEAPVRVVRVIRAAAPGSDTLDLVSAGEGLYLGDLGLETGADSVVYYYEALDALGRTARLPETGSYATTIAIDTQAPTIAHEPLRDFVETELPVPITATVKDNGSIDEDSVVVAYTFTTPAGSETNGSFRLERTAVDSVFAAFFPEGPGRVGTISYRITAVDLSPLRNRITSPASGFHAFEIYSPATRLVLRGPNPFAESIAFELSLAADAEVKLAVFDLAGRLVRRIADGPIERGVRSLAWDGTNEEGRRVAAGSYLYRLETGGLAQSGVVVLLR